MLTKHRQRTYITCTKTTNWFSETTPERLSILKSPLPRDNIDVQITQIRTPKHLDGLLPGTKDEENHTETLGPRRIL